MLLSWLLIITILAAALSIFDGVRRLRGHHSNSVLAILELVFAVLMLVSIFIAFPAPLGTFIFALALEVVLVLILLFRGKSRAGGYTTVTLVALILNSIVVLIAVGWLHIPGLG
jgi:hypothetical protein